MQYQKERKEAVLKKVMPPHNRSIVDLAKQDGISKETLYNWRRPADEAHERELLLPYSDTAPKGWNVSPLNWKPVVEVCLKPADKGQTSARGHDFLQQLCWQTQPQERPHVNSHTRRKPFPKRARSSGGGYNPQRPETVRPYCCSQLFYKTPGWNYIYRTIIMEQNCWKCLIFWA